MRTGSIILCRYSSSRLPGKILRTINNKTILEHIVDRLQLVKNNDQIVVATTLDTTDDVIKQKCDEIGIPCYRGSKENVAERFLGAAEHFRLDHAVRINGDNLFVDHSLVERMISIAVSASYDLVTNAVGRTFPYGMSVEVIRTEFYRRVYKEFIAERHFEHVTTWLYEHPIEGKWHVVKNDLIPEAQRIQLAIDEEKDLQQAEEMMQVLNGSAVSSTLTETFRAYQIVRNGIHS